MTLYEENEQVLQGMRKDGVDLNAERTVDFSHVFDAKKDADAFLEACRRLGYAAEDTTFEDMNHFDITVMPVLVPTTADITRIEQQLGDLAKSYNGRPDGWGFYSV